MSSAGEPGTKASDRIFSRRYSLSGASEFRRVFQQAERSMDRYFTVLHRSNDLDHPRLGLAISRRYLRRAVDRNRIKRLVRESFRAHRSGLAPRDFVFLAKPPLGEAKNADIFASLNAHWRRIATAAPQSNDQRDG